MFLKAIGIKALALSVSISSLILAGERFYVVNMGKLKDAHPLATNDCYAVYIFLKSHPDKMISWIETRDIVKSWKTDRNNSDILYLEFDNGQTVRLHLARALQRFYSKQQSSLKIK